MAKHKKTIDHAATLSPEAQERLQTILDGLEMASGRDSGNDLGDSVLEAAVADKALGLALAQRLGGYASRLSAYVLTHIAARHPDKAVVKEAKRSLYRLDQQGVKAPVGTSADKTAKATAVGSKASRIEAFAGVFDSGGRRMLLAATTKPGGGLMTAGAVLSLDRGMDDFLSQPMSKREWRKFLKKVIDGADLPMASIEAGHLMLLLEEARAAVESRSEQAPQAYFDFKGYLKGVEAYLKCPIWHRFDRAELAVDNQARQAAADLHAEPVFEPLFLAREKLAQTIERVHGLIGGTLVLTPAQKQERLDDIISRSAAEVLGDDGQRRLLARRIEETAFILDHIGQGDQARLALRVVIDLDGADTAADSPFVHRLILKSLRFHLPEVAGLTAGEEPGREAALDDGGSGLIIP